MPHAGNSGLQQHNVGPNYPWSVVIIDNADGGFGHCVARNLINGDSGQRHDYRGDIPGSFDRANNAAEQNAAKLAADDRTIAAGRAEQARVNTRMDADDRQYRRDKLAAAEVSPFAELSNGQLWQCTVYIPALSADVGTEIYPAFRNWLEHTFNGFTIGPYCRGFWRNPADGSGHFDAVTPLHIAVNDPRELRALLRPWVLHFGQTCLYFLGPYNDVHLLYPPPVAVVETDGRHNWYGTAE